MTCFWQVFFLFWLHQFKNKIMAFLSMKNKKIKWDNTISTDKGRTTVETLILLSCIEIYCINNEDVVSSLRIILLFLLASPLFDLHVSLIIMFLFCLGICFSCYKFKGKQGFFGFCYDVYM